MKKTETFARKIVAPLYALALLGMFGILAAVCVTREHHAAGKTSADYVDVSDGWTLDREGKEPVDLNNLGEYMDEETGVLSIWHRLPYMDSDKSLVYRSKDVYTKVLIGGRVLYETDAYQSRFYNRSPGNLWNIAKVSSGCSKALMEMQIYMVYDKSAVTVDFTMWGDKTDIIMGLCQDKTFGLVLSALMTLIGLVLIVIDIMPASVHTRKHHGMLWLGVYSGLIGVWSLIETNVVQFFVSDMRILQLIDNMIMVMDAMPLMLYLDCEYQVLKNRLVRIFCYLDALYVLAAIAAQILGISDMHAFLPGALLAVATGCVGMMIWGIIRLRRVVKSRQPALDYALEMAGLGSLWLSVLFEMLRWSQSDRMDRAEYLRVGMFGFIICFAIRSQLETYKLLENGLKFDIISSLAYSDGLTGLGNRTAYLEQLDAYANGQAGIAQLGIVFLDVNNLKKVNDNQGHEKGDELIMLAARIISESFGKFGKPYRIGGDEFCVFITGLPLEEKYQEGLNVFKRLIDEENKSKQHTFEVQIANGFGICDIIDREKIDEAVMSADSAMYANKRFLKGIC